LLVPIPILNGGNPVKILLNATAVAAAELIVFGNAVPFLIKKSILGVIELKFLLIHLSDLRESITISKILGLDNIKKTFSVYVKLILH
jgi:hypothetical protein